MNSEPLQAVSNVIELKPGKKYVLVLKGNFTMEMLDMFAQALVARGIEGVAVGLHEDEDMTVIEVPESEQAE